MYKIIEDPNHKYLRLDPIPSVETVEKYYKEDFYSEKNPAFNDSSFEVQQKDKLFFDSRWNRVHDICKSYLGDLKNKTIYDIGFGYAQALIFFKERGLICSGIEPSEEGVKYAREKGIDGKLLGIEDKSSYIVEQSKTLSS